MGKPIIKQTNNQLIPLSSLNYGHTFIYYNDICMLTNDENEEEDSYIVNLNNGNIFNLSWDTQIQPIQITITY